MAPSVRAQPAARRPARDSAAQPAKKVLRPLGQPSAERNLRDVARQNAAPARSERKRASELMADLRETRATGLKGGSVQEAVERVQKRRQEQREEQLRKEDELLAKQAQRLAARRAQASQARRRHEARLKGEAELAREAEERARREEEAAVRDIMAVRSATAGWATLVEGCLGRSAGQREDDVRRVLLYAMPRPREGRALGRRRARERAEVRRARSLDVSAGRALQVQVETARDDQLLTGLMDGSTLSKVARVNAEELRDDSVLHGLLSARRLPELPAAPQAARDDAALGTLLGSSEAPASSSSRGARGDDLALSALLQGPQRRPAAAAPPRGGEQATRDDSVLSSILAGARDDDVLSGMLATAQDGGALGSMLAGARDDSALSSILAGALDDSAMTSTLAGGRVRPGSACAQGSPTQAAESDDAKLLGVLAARSHRGVEAAAPRSASPAARGLQVQASQDDGLLHALLGQPQRGHRAASALQPCIGRDDQVLQGLLGSAPQADQASRDADALSSLLDRHRT